MSLPLRALKDVRPEERRVAAAAFFTLFGTLAAHTVLETARDALFLARLAPSQLPIVYLAMAAVAVVISQGGAQRLLAGRFALSVLLIVSAGVTALMWLFGNLTDPWMLRALYVWTGLVGSLTALQFWMVLGEQYTVTQAKRLYRVIGVGSVLGAIAGGLVARQMAATLAAHDLVLASAALFAVTGLGPALLIRRPESAGSAALRGPTSVADAIATMTDNPYVKGLAGLVLVSTVGLTLADYVFKSTVVKHVAAPDLGSFFAGFYTVLNVLALVTQVGAMGFILRRFGLHRAQWILPGFILVSAAGVALGGGLWAALVLKGADGALRHSLHRTTTELMFVPIPDTLRSRAKPFIDIVGQRGGQALASIFILADATLQRGDVWMAAASAALCVVWIAWSMDLRSHYLDLFRTALLQGALRKSEDLPELDLSSLEALFVALNSRDDSEVIAALDLLEEQGRSRIVPALILYHPSTAVLVRALGLLERSGRKDFLPLADRLLGHGDHEVRAAALCARNAAAPEEAQLRAAVGDVSPLVKATALAGLVATGLAEPSDPAIVEITDYGSTEARAALARAVARQPAPAFESLLLALADSPEHEVQVEVARAMGLLKSKAFLPALLPMLQAHEPREAARQAFQEYGGEALPFLEEALADEKLPHEIRRHVPRTISRFPGPAAAPILLRRLTSEEDGMVRFKLLRGLGRLAARHPDLKLDRSILRDATERTLRAAFRLIDWRISLERGAAQEPRRATPGHALLKSLLRDKEAHAIERLFRLLGLQYRSENVENIYRGLKSENPRVRASSRELIEALVKRPLGDAVLALVDDVPDQDRLQHGAAYYEPQQLEYEALIEMLLQQPGETLRSIAIHHVGELGLVAFRPRLLGFRGEETGFFVMQVLERALGRLAEPGSGGLQLAR